MTAPVTAPPTPDIAALAAHGLPGTRHTLPAAPAAPQQFPQLLDRLQRHRLIGLAAAAAQDGALVLDDDQREALQAAHLEAMCTCLHLEATMLEVARVFGEHGIDLRVIKGPASAHLDYPRPELRAFGDLDLLVRSADIDRATAVLSSLGFRRLSPEPRPGFDRRFGKGATFAADDGTGVDLHRTFVMGPLGLRIDLDEVWRESASFTTAGTSVAALTGPHRLLTACYNAVIGDRSPRLSTLRDIVQLCLGDAADAEAVQDCAIRWGGEAVLAHGIQAAWSALKVADVVALSAWAARYEATHDDGRLLALYHDPAAGYAGLSWATARMLPVRERIAFLRALALPRGGRLGKRGWGLTERARRAARGLHRSGS